MKIENPIRQVLIDRAIIMLIPELQRVIGDALDNGTWKNSEGPHVTYHINFNLDEFVGQGLLVEQAKALIKPPFFKRLFS